MKYYTTDGYKFHFNELSNNIQRWAYTKRLYKSYFKLSENSEIMFSVLNREHDVNILTRQKASNKLKRKALNDACKEAA